MSKRVLWVVEIRERELRFRKLPAPRTVSNRKAYWGKWSAWRPHHNDLIGGGKPLTRVRALELASRWTTQSEQFRVVKYIPA